MISKMKKLILFAAIVISALLFNSCGNDYTLDIYGSISGQVTDFTSGEPLINA